MAINPITDPLISFLNSLLEIDRKGVSAALLERHPCNPLLSEHDTVQISVTEQEGSLYGEVNALGIINGFCGVFDDGPLKDRGPITAIVENNQVIHFVRTDRTTRRVG